MKHASLKGALLRCALLFAVTACSNTDGEPAGQIPAGPIADVSEALSTGNGPFIGAATGLAVPAGYEQHEYVAAGMATDYAPQGELTADGLWTFVPGTTAPYRTRVLVRRPANPGAFSGTVVVEWLNVSGGVDANPDYANLEEEIVRQGHVWIGVSAQRIGVEGGPVLVKAPGAEDLVGKGLKAIDPVRYGTLQHPGDGYAYDMFTQVARAARSGGPLLGGLTPDLVLAAGESQSAIALTTYYNGVQPLTRAFDGFFVHSRAAVFLPLVAPGEHADLAGSLGGTVRPIFRGDLAAPVMDLQAENDVTGVLNSGLVRQPDSDRFRLWEAAGTAHADAHLLGSMASSIDCDVPVNDGPMHFVSKAALRHLETWARMGTPPPVAPRLTMTMPMTTGMMPAAKPDIARDADGIALGGLRTPPVDVPVDVLSGVPGRMSDVLCLLLGSTVPLSDARLAERYGNRATYESAYGAATDTAIAAGFVLEEDRAALQALAQPTRIAP